MKFKIRKKTVLNALSKVQGLTGRKTNLAITTNVLVKTGVSGISITATDLETGFEGVYPAEIESEGVLAINARMFYDIAREFPSEEISINEIENHWIEISDKKVEYHIVGMNPEDFPELPLFEDISLFEIETSVFADMIDKTSFITGQTDDKRAHISGIFFENLSGEEEKALRMVSTDGSRLSKADFVPEQAVDFFPGKGVIVPKKGLNEVRKILDQEGKASIGVKNSNFVAKTGDETIIIRLLEGEFPQYYDIIKKSDKHIIKMEKIGFLNMLKRMSILYSDDYKGVIFKFKDDKLTITSTNPDKGESKEDISIKFQGDTIETAFNPRFFIETLNAIDEENILININNSESPCLIEGEKEKGYLSAIMPMRI